MIPLSSGVIDVTLTPEELEKKLREAQSRKEKAAKGGMAKSHASDAAGASMAFRTTVELVSALVVGGFLGYLIDGWLGTRPWFMIVFFFLGSIAGILNVYRAQTGQEYKVGFRTVADLREDDGTAEDEEKTANKE